MAYRARGMHVQLPKGKSIHVAFGKQVHQTDAEIKRDAGMAHDKQVTKRHRMSENTKRVQTGARATAAGSVGNNAVDDAYELLRGGVNEEGQDDRTRDDQPVPTPKPRRNWDEGSRI